MTTPADDVDAMFDLPPLADEPSTATAEALAAAEAALAAEFASALEPGGVAADAPDSRIDLRVQVAWRARMRLPDGHVVELEVRNVSETGVGLASDEDVPARTAVAFEMDVPPLGEGGGTVSVKGTLRTTYTVAHGTKMLCGGTWESPPAELALLTGWIEALRR